MLLHREFLIAALVFGIAVSLYLYSFRDLMAVPAAMAGVERSSTYVGHL